MKALCRNSGETITESMEIKGIDWDSGLPFTDPEMPGGSFKLFTNYKAPKAIEIDQPPKL